METTHEKVSPLIILAWPLNAHWAGPKYDQIGRRLALLLIGEAVGLGILFTGNHWYRWIASALIVAHLLIGVGVWIVDLIIQRREGGVGTF